MCVQCLNILAFLLYFGEFPPPHFNPVFTVEINDGAQKKGGREGEWEGGEGRREGGGGGRVVGGRELRK